MAEFESNHVEDDEIANATTTNNHGWQKVTYPKRQRKALSKPSDPSKPPSNGSASAVGSDKVFRSLEKHSEERRMRLQAQRDAIAQSEVSLKPKPRSDDYDDDDDSDAEAVVQNGAVDEKKVKPKKVKKPKVTVGEAAAKIDAADLAGFLVEVTASYEGQQDIQLMRFADYFGRAFAGVSGAQFPWAKLFRESTVAKIVDIPVTHISEAVYKTSVDWINQRSSEALQSFVLWSIDSILADLPSQQGGVKGSKKSVHPTSSKSQVAIFVVLAMVLRRKPDVLLGILPTLRENSKYQGQDKLPVIVWMAAQASQGDLAVGLFSWAHNLLPIVGGKSSCNPQSRDLILQLVERILSSPKARTVLINGAVRKGDRLLPPLSLDLLMRVTFPASSARVKATERFEAIYPTLKEVALAGSAGSKAMKQVAQQPLPCSHMASFFCSAKFFLLLLVISAVPIAYLISLETAKPTSHVYHYHSTGWLREGGKWDDLNRRFLVSFMEGGVGQIRVPDDHSSGTILEEVRVITDVDLKGNASLGILVDPARNRLLVAIADVFGNRYGALAAYDLTTWDRLFLTQLSGPGDGKTFADDVTVDSEGNAYVTDAKENKIWKVGANGEFLSTITSPLFIAKEWYKNLVGLNGIVYHPNGYLIVVHTFSGNLFKVEINKGDEVKLIEVEGGPLSFGDGLELLSPTRLVVAGNPSRLVESSDDWETAVVVGKSKGQSHRLVTAATVKDGKVYLNHILGMGYPRRKHVFMEAVFDS